MRIIFRDIKIDDLEDYINLNHPDREFHKFNGPYYEKETLEELRERVEGYRKKLLKGENTVLEKKKLIVDSTNDKILGEVSWYWKSKETNWLEVGIVIFNEACWGRGIGAQAMKQWIDEVFDTQKEIVRVGLTTWSGNIGMMKVAQKLGLVKEATYRNARIVDGYYYDSISYGILRDEWEKSSYKR